MMARTTRHLITSVTVCVLLWVGVSHAIVWGVPDGHNHPNVGALFVSGSGNSARCSITFCTSAGSAGTPASR